MATGQQEKEKELYREVSRTVTTALPGVEVLALEMTGRERFCVYVDHPRRRRPRALRAGHQRAPALPREVLDRGLVARARAAAAHP